MATKAMCATLSVRFQLVVNVGVGVRTTPWIPNIYETSRVQHVHSRPTAAQMFLHVSTGHVMEPDPDPRGARV